ncbi:MAG TPA: DEAD/DEAH box helicase family protein [Clostridiales bacterium]|nr:DEAD/DEAH box helicase family protein [Clostridiales bacterium]
MLQIPDSLIINYSMSPQVYRKGVEYYRMGRIKSVRILEDKMVIYAIVRGSQDYQVSIVFNENGIFQSADCTCPAGNKNWGHCKHIVAVLLHLKKLKEKGKMQKVMERRVSRQIFKLFEHTPSFNKTAVTLIPVYEFKPAYEDIYGVSSLLSLRIGIDRLYVVRNISRFVEQVVNGEAIEFGKSFTFDPYWHDLPDEHGTLFGFIKEIHEIEQMSTNSYGSKSGIFRDKYICLTDSLVKRFFALVGNQPFEAVLCGQPCGKIQIKNERIPAAFSVETEEDSLILEIKTKGMVIPITADHSFIMAGNDIYHPPIDQIRSLTPFLRIMNRSESKKLRFYNEDRNRFISEILPFAQNAGSVNISESLNDILIKEPLAAEVYFDRDIGGIQARVEFHYGDRVLNPFDNRRNEAEDNGKILVRDIDAERSILALFEQYAFLVRPGGVYLENDDMIFEFFQDGLPRLAELAAVYYSDDFKITIRDRIVYSAGIRLNRNTNLLEFSFDTGDIDPEELLRILAALREKKRYYRLKDGTFLSLGSKDILGLAEIVEDLGLKDADLKEESINLPKYRALYMDRRLMELGLEDYEIQIDIKKLLYDVQNPGDIQTEPPNNLKSILRDYQQLGFKWLKTLSYYGLGGILADDMGLGKTLQILALLQSDKEEGCREPSLVIAPTSLVYNWEDEVQKFVPGLSTLIITGTKHERKKLIEKIPDTDLVITSYPLIRRDREEYQSYTFRYCIIDEAQHIKNPLSQNARAVKSVNAKHRFALTGTPIENSLTELWSIFDFIMPGYLFSRSKFAAEYEKPIVKDHDEDAAQKLASHIKPFVLRRLKNDVLKELPEKIESRMVAELTEEQKKIYLAYLARARGEISAEIERSGYERSHIKILSALTRLRQICCHPGIFLENYKGDSGKLLQMEELVTDALSGGHRILIFSQFTTMLKLIRQRLQKLRIQTFYLDGDTEAQERNMMVKSFNDGEKEVFLISLKAGGTGLNLTGADTVIHYDPWWNPAVEEQASDRAYRIGQKKAVHVMRMITRGTIEEKIERLKEKKKSLADAVIQPGETFISKLTREEVMALFE